MQNIRLGLEWLKMRRVVLLYVLAVFACFCLVYGLYGLDFMVAGYALLLSAVLGAWLAAWDLYRFVKKHVQLGQRQGRYPISSLPEPANLIEQDYQRMVFALEAERRRLEKAEEEGRRDAEEYYTLWAHQIKNPMAAMGLVLQSGSGRLAAQERANVEQELLRIQQYVEMVLQYQRLSSVENDMALERVDVLPLVKRAAKHCAPLFIYKNLPLEVAEFSKEVITDEKWLCFVLEQLLSNAAKYTHRGRVKVYLQENTLVVEDTGVGIAPEDLPRVFERGFTGAVGRIERSSTGIGLYLSRRIATRLGFGLSIESTRGKGTRVLLLLEQEKLEPI